MASRRKAKDRAKAAAPAPVATEPPGGDLFGAAEPVVALWGEWLRRAALGILAGLLAARAYFPGEDAEQGSGSGWLLVLILTLGLAAVSAWLGGKVRLRWSWADLAVGALVMLVVVSVGQGAERRLALTMGFEWIGLGVAYFLLRWLPGGRAESTALAGAFLATSCALAAAGFYQRLVEDPASIRHYRRNPQQALREANVPDDPASRRRFEDRLMNSTEPRATFALANSLAGYLVGPAVFGVAAAVGLALGGGGAGVRLARDRLVPLSMAALPLLGVLVCLVLTKSRSAYLGLAAGLAAALLPPARRLDARRRAGVVVVVLGLLVAIGAVAALRGLLDRQVLTESTKSLRYRVEYWRGAWGVITESPRRFWNGVGPANFAGPYLRHKLPTSSEEIKDPHNLILDVWAASGALAAAALVVALVLALRETWGRGRGAAEGEADADAPPPRWLWFSAGAGGLVLVALVGGLDPLGDPEAAARWAVLAVGWTAAALLLRPLWNRRPAEAPELGAALLAVAVTLLAVGGIAFPPVALALWTAAALGQNLREDRPGGRPRVVGGRWLAFGLMLGVAALLGSFLGTFAPSWKAGAALRQAHAAMARRGVPNFDAAREALQAAAAADPLDPRPWMDGATLEVREWDSQGSPPGSRVWLKVSRWLDQAVAPPRNPNSLPVQGLRMALLRELIGKQAASLSPEGLLALRTDLANAAARAVALYPSDARLNADLAEAAADIGRYPEAARHAREALRLDALTPHNDHRLSPEVRARLRENEPRWSSGTGS